MEDPVRGLGRGLPLYCFAYSDVITPNKSTLPHTLNIPRHLFTIFLDPDWAPKKIFPYPKCVIPFLFSTRHK